VAKLSVTATGDSLSSFSRAGLQTSALFPIPTLQVAIEPQTKATWTRWALPSSACSRKSHRRGRAVGDRRADTPLDGRRSRGRPGRAAQAQVRPAIVTKTPRVAYKETIRGRLRPRTLQKQTAATACSENVGSRSSEPWGGVEFAEHVVGGTVPKNFFPGVEKGVREAAAEGVLAGYR